ncbi:MAG TPA: acyl-CoA dehydrogenase family protein [Acidimicrobiales bacterium]|nr:acyl-CoA dehydrogenase family protein [Acidimicrobiales bacterium]
MTDTTTGALEAELDELRDWLRDTWDPDLTVGAWWERLGMAGWAQPLLPRDAYGRGMGHAESLAVHREIERHGALGAPTGLGLLLAAPTIATHGTPDQVARYVPDIVTGRRAWCQLFSEPGAGSDLAGLSTRAVRDGDSWIVNGQKVWTSGGHLADLGMLLARTNPDVPKHRGITWFAIDMRQPGVEVRPLREMTGSTMFSEVFLTDAVVTDDARIGDVDDGWRVANTTLTFERTGMGGGGRSLPPARPGTVTGDLSLRAGDLVAARPGPAATPSGPRQSPAADLIALAARRGRSGDPVVRQALVRLHVLGELARVSGLRQRAARAAGHDVPGLPSFTKLMMGDALRLRRDLGLRLLGPAGTLHGYTDEERAGLTSAAPGVASPIVTGQALAAQALPIFGGTDQIQRNILAERVLGLPKEPGDLSQVPFSQLPRNA